MAEQELKLLRQKFEAQEIQFQNYRDQCKTLQSFLEEENNKKQNEIRKLKQESITKEKNYKLIKTQNTQLLSELSTLRAEISSLQTAKASNLSASSNLQQKIKDISAELSRKAAQLAQYKQREAVKDKQIKNLTNESKQLKILLEDKEGTIKRYEQKITKLQQILQQQKKENDHLFSKNNEISKTVVKSRDEATVRKVHLRTQSSHYQLQTKQTKVNTQQKLKRYEDKILKLEKIIKELKHKLEESTFSSTLTSSKVKEEHTQTTFKMYIGCVILTKPHYLSPFLDVNEQTKTIKLFKPARNGCFEKSLGSTKHKFTMLTYHRAEVVKDIVNKIKNYEFDIPHSILIFGTKKSAKKNILTEIITEMFEFLVSKLKHNESAECSATYIKKNYDQICNKEQVFNTQQILQLLQKLINTSGSSELKRSERSLTTKKAEKPRITYLSLIAGQFILEIATSSFTNISIKQKDDASTFYNNVLYSKLPNVLQNAYGQKYLIFTLNPIVDFYDECKNTLNVTVCKSLFISPSKNIEKENDSPNKQMLNTLVRKKFENYERQMEHTYLKLKKVEDQCGYYRSKFSELEDRLKKLIITHNGQNYYLKKSPILLAYQKMLKFIHSVQARNQTTLEPTSNIIQLDQIDFEVHDQSQQCL